MTAHNESWARLRGQKNSWFPLKFSRISVKNFEIVGFVLSQRSHIGGERLSKNNTFQQQKTCFTTVCLKKNNGNDWSWQKHLVGYAKIKQIHCIPGTGSVNWWSDQKTTYPPETKPIALKPRIAIGSRCSKPALKPGHEGGGGNHWVVIFLNQSFASELFFKKIPHQGFEKIGGCQICLKIQNASVGQISLEKNTIQKQIGISENPPFHSQAMSAFWWPICTPPFKALFGCLGFSSVLRCYYFCVMSSNDIIWNHGWLPTARFMELGVLHPPLAATLTPTSCIRVGA